MRLERVRVEKLVAGGLGLGRLYGRVTLVPGALPGELVEVRVLEQKHRLEGALVRVLEPSIDRVEPPRDAPPTMDLGHAGYAAQLEYKRGFVLESLERIGKLEAEVSPTRASPLEWGYRNGAQYLVTPRGLAYRERGSRRPVLVQHDPLVTDLIADGLGSLEPRELEPSTEIAFRASFETGEVLACLIGLGKTREYYHAREHLRDLGVVGVDFAFASLEGRFRDGVQRLWGQEHLLERYGDVTLSVNASSFAQVNPLAAGALYHRAARLAGSGAHALDLYGGSGGLAFHLRGHFDHVTVLEINPQAVARGLADAKRLGLEVEFVRGDATRLAGLEANVITLDPPRAGLSPEALEALGQSGAGRIVYVSCDPSTWARDVGRLTRFGYRLETVEPWDFYPHTHHVEVLSLLVGA